MWPVLGIVMALIIRVMIPGFRAMQTRLDNVNRVMREQITGIRVVRAFVRERHEMPKQFEALILTFLGQDYRI